MGLGIPEMLNLQEAAALELVASYLKAEPLPVVQVQAEAVLGAMQGRHPKNIAIYLTLLKKKH